MADITLDLFTVPVRYKSGSVGEARAEGNNASWACECGESLPLIGRCYFQFGHDCHTVCPNDECGRRYRVMADAQKRAREVEEF